MTDLLPISLPANWNEEKDCAYFEDRWEPAPSYTDALWWWMRFHHGDYVQTLDVALRYFRRHDATLVDTDLGCLTSHEKVTILLEIAGSSPRVST